jgi:hypothetical protein
MSVINLTAAEKRKVRRIILLCPKPAKVHRKAVILYQLARWNDVQKIARYCHSKPATVAKVLEEYRSSGLEGVVTARSAEAQHRKQLEDVENRAPDREKFQAMLERFPAPDQWLDDEDDWNL